MAACGGVWLCSVLCGVVLDCVAFCDGVWGRLVVLGACGGVVSTDKIDAK